MGKENLDTYSIDITRSEMRDILIKGSINFLQSVFQKLSQQQ